MTETLKEMLLRTMLLLVITLDVCWGSDPPKSYGPSPPNDNYQNNYEPEFQRPLAVFTERPVNVANFVLIPIVQVPSSDLRMIYRPQIDSVSKTEPIIMCKSLTKSFLSSYPPNPMAIQPYSAQPPSQYSVPPPSQYPASSSQYSAAQSPHYQYSQPAPPSPTYYQHSGDTGGGYVEESNEPPGKLYSQLAAASFQNSKESPLLHQLREESEKNRHKYVPPSYNNNYQTVDAA